MALLSFAFRIRFLLDDGSEFRVANLFRNFRSRVVVCARWGILGIDSNGTIFEGFASASIFRVHTWWTIRGDAGL